MEQAIAAEQVALAAEEGRAGDVTAIWSNGSENCVGVMGLRDGRGHAGVTCLHCLALGPSELLCLCFIPAKSSVGTETEKP